MLFFKELPKKESADARKQKVDLGKLMGFRLFFEELSKKEKAEARKPKGLLRKTDGF